MIAQMATESADRKSMKIAVTPAAKAAVAEFSEQYDMTEYAVASRFYEWFAEQDDIYQRAVMGMLHGLEVDAARAYMTRWAEAARAKAATDGIEVGQAGTTPPAPTSAPASSSTGAGKDSSGKPRTRRGRPSGRAAKTEQGH